MPRAWGLAAHLYPAASISPSVRSLLETSLALHMESRKDLLLATRVRDSPLRNSFLLSQLFHNDCNPIARTVHDIFPAINIHTMLHILFTDCFHSTIYSSYVSMMIRNIPFYAKDFGKIEDVQRVQSLRKEFLATQSEPHEQKLDYRCIFGGPNDIVIPISSSLPPRPELSLEFRSLLHRWKRSAFSLLTWQAPQFPHGHIRHV